MKNILLIVLIFISNPGFSQSIKNFVDSCYSFNPHELTNEEINKKFALLDEFWNKIESDKDLYLPLLRKELIADGHNPFFYYDCGSLLLRNSTTDEDYETAFNATKKTDLRDVQCADFLKKSVIFAQRGYNTYEFAEKILETNDFKAFLVNHAISLDKDYSLLFILLPLSPDLYIDKLIARLKNEKAVDNQLAIITVLGYACTCKADTAIENYSLRNDLDNKIKKRIEMFQKMKHEKQNDQKVKELIDKRNKELLSRLSDEALYELDHITIEIKKNYTCH